MKSLIGQLGDLGLGPLDRLTRTKADKEIYCLRRYLLTLGHNALLEFPLSIKKSETPDFKIGGASTFGIEVVEATDPTDQREYTLAARSKKKIWKDGEFGGRGKGGFFGDWPEHLWESYLVEAVKRKMALSYSTARTKILLYSNSNAGGHVEAETAVQLIKQLLVQQPELQQAWNNIDEITIIKGDTIIFDVARASRLLALYDR